MKDINALRVRLETAEIPSDIAVLMEAAWDGFGVLVAGCRAGSDRSGTLFAAFSYAGAAAAQARVLLWAAPSLPGACGWESVSEENVACDVEVLADALAGLAETLSTRLALAASHADAAGDRAACADAGQEAAQVFALLTRGPG